MRIDSYDLLRTLATFSVVLLHLSGMWITDQAMVKSHELITLAYIYIMIYLGMQFLVL